MPLLIDYVFTGVRREDNLHPEGEFHKRPDAPQGGNKRFSEVPMFRKFSGSQGRLCPPVPMWSELRLPGVTTKPVLKFKNSHTRDVFCCAYLWSRQHKRALDLCVWPTVIEVVKSHPQSRRYSESCDETPQIWRNRCSQNTRRWFYCASLRRENVCV